jgi:hypothetical protein
MGLFMEIYAGAWLTYQIAFAEAAHPHRELASEIRRQTDGPVIFFRAESHLLAYHLGAPVGTVLEWENLEKWTHKPRIVYYVMLESCAAEAAERIPALEEVTRSAAAAGERRLVVMRSRLQPSWQGSELAVSK